MFKQKSAYEMRISDWSSDVCSSDLVGPDSGPGRCGIVIADAPILVGHDRIDRPARAEDVLRVGSAIGEQAFDPVVIGRHRFRPVAHPAMRDLEVDVDIDLSDNRRSEESCVGKARVGMCGSWGAEYDKKK